VIFFIRHGIRYDFEWTIAKVLIYTPLSTQAAHYSPLHPDWDPLHWLSTTRPTVISPEQIPETSVPVTLPPRLCDENFGVEFRAFADDQIRANGSTPGRVSEQREWKKKILANTDVISPSRIKKILLEEPIRNSIRGAGATCSSVTPTNSALHPTISHHVYHHGSWKTCEALTLSNAIRTKESKHQSLANFNGSQKWELRRVPRTGQRAPRSGRAITKVAIKAMDGARKLYGT
jgi:hypothetical protein